MRIFLGLIFKRTFCFGFSLTVNAGVLDNPQMWSRREDEETLTDIPIISLLMQNRALESSKSCIFLGWKF